MTQALSQDLRSRAIAAVDGGLSCNAAETLRHRGVECDPLGPRLACRGSCDGFAARWGPSLTPLYRPRLGQRAIGLQNSNLLVQQIALDQRGTKFASATRSPVLPRYGLGGQYRFPGGQKRVAPAAQRRRGHQGCARPFRGLRHARAATPRLSCVVATSCHHGRATLRQTLVVAQRRPAALHHSCSCP
jgi:hypothetical protein